jgi:type IV pilus biogenesis protein CpaD/CtpE
MKTAPKRTAALALAVSALAALAAGCASRAHLTPSHGQATRAAFTSQAANPNAAQRPHKMPGLDAQEAGIVVKNYRRALTTKGTQSEDQGMLLLAAPPANQQPYLPPPSVPQDRK